MHILRRPQTDEVNGEKGEREEKGERGEKGEKWGPTSSYGLPRTDRHWNMFPSWLYTTFTKGTPQPPLGGSPGCKKMVPFQLSGAHNPRLVSFEDEEERRHFKPFSDAFTCLMSTFKTFITIPRTAFNPNSKYLDDICSRHYPRYSYVPHSKLSPRSLRYLENFTIFDYWKVVLIWRGSGRHPVDMTKRRLGISVVRVFVLIIV
jgi:hypothetical protein